ncbi:MAG: DUF2029 domain-containing protein [Acidimicrobiia bacterium]|nr:DUF2029 domain-containing protein [Acidimicrobiia bacterium]
MSTTASNRVPPLFLFALVAVHVAAAAALLRDPGVKTPAYAATSDAGRYHEIATSRGHPYRDFEVEYPPLAYLGLDAIDTGDFDSTLNILIVTQLLADLGIVGLLLWNWGSRAAVSYLIIAAPMLATVLTKFDLVSVLLALLAVSLVSRSRDGPGGVALAASVFVKLWPVVLTPWLLVKRRWRAMAWTLAGGFAGVALWAWLGDIDGPRQVLTFRGAEGWHVESIPAQLALLGGAGDMRFEAGSWRIGAPRPGSELSSPSPLSPSPGGCGTRAGSAKTSACPRRFQSPLSWSCRRFSPSSSSSGSCPGPPLRERPATGELSD